MLRSFVRVFRRCYRYWRHMYEQENLILSPTVMGSVATDAHGVSKNRFTIAEVFRKLRFKHFMNTPRCLPVHKSPSVICLDVIFSSKSGAIWRIRDNMLKNVFVGYTIIYQLAENSGVPVLGEKQFLQHRQREPKSRTTRKIQDG